jgi:cob(I)alamin adenosyltransferase
MLEKGLVQVYTGNGKGKTTAAFGLALRAAGQGNKVLIYQFLKPPSLDVGERFAVQLGAVRIRVEALEEDWDMATSLDDTEAVARTRAAIRDVLARLTAWDDIKRLIEHRDPAVEIVMTGRDAPVELVELADLVTEMKCIKHPFEKGVPARRGIDY